MDGLVSRTSPGGPRQIPDLIRAKVLALTRTTPPPTWGISHWVVAAYPGQKVHVVLDNASVRLSGDTEEWLAKQGGKVVFHFTPTGASWMNQIEIWNGIIARKLIRCGTFRSVKVKWTATAEEILDKVRAITARMDALLGATEIGDVARQEA
ncbi:MAG: transposase [Pseudonocardiaceae bacterium]